MNTRNSDIQLISHTAFHFLYNSEVGILGYRYTLVKALMNGQGTGERVKHSSDEWEEHWIMGRALVSERNTSEKHK